MSSMRAADDINEKTKAIAALYAEQSKRKAQLLALTPWLDLDVPLETASTREATVMFGTINGNAHYEAVEKELRTATELAQLTPAGKDREFRYLLFVCHKSAEEAAMDVLKKYGFSRATLRGWTGTARENARRLEAGLAGLERELKEKKAAIAAYGGQREALKISEERLRQEIGRETAKSRLLATQATFFLEGWVPASDLSAVEADLRTFTCAWETADPVEEEYPQVPIKLKSNALTRSMSMVTEMYSLPAYDGVDPNPLILPFFVFFFGFMYADLGYGLVLVTISLIVRAKAKPKGTMGQLFEIMTLVGVSSAVIGFFTGGFFGDSIATVAGLLGKPVPNLSFLTNPIVSVTEDPVTVLIFCVGVGCVQIITGMAIKAYMLIRDGKILDAVFDVGSWWVVFAGIAVGVLKGTWVVALIGAAMLVLTQGRGSPKLLGKIVGGIGSLYDITAYFGDALSYARLMVMMLAGSVIGSIFNMLGAMPGNLFVFALIFLIGHAFNMGINIIGTYVHTTRLQYLEYFGKFYKEGGRPFKPLRLDTKYVDIVKEET
ncbi:MAG: V-type ATP synthase subunit I [Clostridiales bacterium]|nr:V-type ATP synthase subunit I [Clostridiales bacterium]